MWKMLFTAPINFTFGLWMSLEKLTKLLENFIQGIYLNKKLVKGNDAYNATFLAQDFEKLMKR